MKKSKIVACTLVCSLVGLLCGCSACGDFVNFFTNGCAGFFEACAGFYGCFFTRCAVSCATCGFCGGIGCSDCGLYDCMTGYTCHVCSETCRSYIHDFDSTHIIEGNYTIVQAEIAEIKLINSIKYEHGESDDYYKLSAVVRLTFAESFTADNVWVESTISTKGISDFDQTIKSTRWLGTVNGGEEYKLDPEYYVNFTNEYNEKALKADNYNFTVIVYYGE